MPSTVTLSSVGKAGLDAPDGNGGDAEVGKVVSSKTSAKARGDRALCVEIETYPSRCRKASNYR